MADLKSQLEIKYSTSLLSGSPLRKAHSDTGSEDREAVADSGSEDRESAANSSRGDSDDGSALHSQGES